MRLCCLYVWMHSTTRSSWTHSSGNDNEQSGQQTAQIKAKQPPARFNQAKEEREEKGDLPIERLGLQPIILNSTLTKLPTGIISDVLGHLSIRNDNEVNSDNNTSGSEITLSTLAASCAL